MPEIVYHNKISTLTTILNFPQKTRTLWFDLILRAIPDKTVQIVKTKEPLRTLKPLLEAGFLRQRTYEGKAIAGSYILSKKVFYCTSEPTMDEIYQLETLDQQEMELP